MAEMELSKLSGHNHNTGQEKLSSSHSNFDRSHLTDREYIERLILENKELQSTIAKQNKLIETLQDQIKNNESPTNTRFPLRIPTQDNKPPNISDNKNNNENDLPQRSARRRHNPAEQKEYSEKKMVNKKPSASSIISSSSISNSNPNIKNSSVSTPTVNTSLSEKVKEAESNRSSVYSDEEKDITNNDSTLNESINTAADASINTIKPRQNIEQSKLLYNKNNSSTSSFSSYKSRIKLPPTLQLQQQRDSNNKEASIETTLNENVQETLKSPVICDSKVNQVSNDSVSIHSSILASSKFDTPPSQATPQFSNSETSSFKRAPVTPDVFNNASKFPLKLNFIPHSPSEEDTNSYISSPLPNSLHHLHASPGQFTNGYESDVLKTPTTNEFISTDSISRPQAQKTGSSFQVLHTPKLDDDDTVLFIKPEEFHTISITVISTISVNSSMLTSSLRKSDDPNCTISINDRESNKEMWRIRKSYSQLIAFDNEIRPIVEYFGLPPMPEKQLFLSTSPSKIDARRGALQHYFDTIFLIPHIPHMVLFRICRYLSLDFINPLDDFKSGARKEGFLVRRYKGLGTSWKVRWCQVDGPFLEVYENPGGTLLEEIKLKGSQIGRQSTDSVAEDKGHRHALLIMESQKVSKLASLPKHFFCAETDAERDDWIGTLVEFSDASNASIYSSISHDIEHSNKALIETSSSRYDCQDNPDLTGKTYNSNAVSLTSGSTITYNLDQGSTYSINSQEDMNTKDAKETKRLKKRSIFPFRYKASTSNTTSDNTDELQSIQLHVPQEPTLQSYLDQLNLDEDLTKAIFGREIEKVYKLSNHIFFGKHIPSICFRCLDFLTRTGAIYEEGIFRLSGSASTIRQLKDQFNTQFDFDLFESSLKPDIHTVAGLFKTYLRELPTPILGLTANHDLNNTVITNGDSISPSSLALIFKEYVNDPSKFDEIHYDICYVIFKFLKQIIANNQTNRMNLKNVCIVFVPTLNISLEILSTFLVDFDCIFENGKPIPDEEREVLNLHIPNF